MDLRRRSCAEATSGAGATDSSPSLLTWIAARTFAMASGASRRSSPIARRNASFGPLSQRVQIERGQHVDVEALAEDGNVRRVFDLDFIVFVDVGVKQVIGLLPDVFMIENDQRLSPQPTLSSARLLLGVLEITRKTVGDGCEPQAKS